MRFELLPIGGAFRIELEPAIDNRGFFVRSFCADTFAKQGLETHLYSALSHTTPGGEQSEVCIIRRRRTPKLRSCAALGAPHSTSS